MNRETYAARITHHRGTPWEMGYDLGRKLGGRLEASIRRYLELREADFATVYSAVARPASGEVCYTFGGYPAASRGKWGRVANPWEKG